MIRRRQGLQAVLGGGAAVAWPGALRAQANRVGVHALLVGIDSYRLEPLRGCVNDLRLLERHMRPRATSLTTLVDREASRESFLRAWQQVAGRCQRGDWLFFSFSGHGARKPEAVRGSEADGMDDFLVFPAFHPTEAPGEILLDNEIEVMFAELGRRDVTILFLADCCHAGTMTRSVHSAAEGQQRFRTLDGSFSVNALVAALASAPPPPPSPPPAALRHVHLFAGSVESLPVPEVTFDGRRHGALSVVFARMLAAGGSPPVVDVADQVVRGVRAMGDGRQNAEITLGANPSRGLFAPPEAPPATPPRTDAAAALPTTPDTPVRLRVDGRPDDAGRLAIERLSRVQRVEARDEADLIWHATGRQTISALGDLLSANVGPEMLPASVDRFRAVRRLQALTMGQSPDMRVARQDGSTRGLARTAVLQYHAAAHPAGARLALTIERLRHEFLVVFALAGDGTVQLLYPGEGEAPRVDIARPFVIDDIIVQAPFGADHVVAIATARPTTSLVRELNAVHGRQEPLAAVAAVERGLSGGAWQLGLIGIFTRPA